MKLLFTFFVSTIFGLSVFATEQHPDKLFYNGKDYKIRKYPLESYFEKYPDKRPKSGISFALFRRYVATFEIRENLLFLIDIEIRYTVKTKNNDFDFKWKSVLSEIFPDQENIKMELYSGLFVLPQGKRVHYDPKSGISTYKQYKILEIDNGDLIKEKLLTYKEYEEFKEKQFLKFKETDKYQEIKTILQEIHKSDESIDSFLKYSITEFTTKILID